MSVKPVTNFSIMLQAQEPPITLLEARDGTVTITGLPIAPDAQEQLCMLLHLWKYGAMEGVEEIAGQRVATLESAFYR